MKQRERERVVQMSRWNIEKSDCMSARLYSPMQRRREEIKFSSQSHPHPLFMSGPSSDAIKRRGRELEWYTVETVNTKFEKNNCMRTRLRNHYRKTTYLSYCSKAYITCMCMFCLATSFNKHSMTTNALISIAGE